MSGVRHRSCHPGQALVEFALAILIFLLLALGIAEGARLTFGRAALLQATQAGARVAALPATATAAQVVTVVQDAARPTNVSAVTVTIAGGKPFAERMRGDQVTVTAQYQFTPVVGIVFGAGGFTFTAQARATVE
jgi:Flp pilus assembly protein TadG